MRKSSQFNDRAHYIGSLPKDGQMYDFYKVVVAGHVRYIYFESDLERELE